MNLLHWDTVNKWLYLGTGKDQDKPFTIMFDNWYWFSRQPSIREWKLFSFMWDNGAWWGDLPDKEEISIPHMNGDYMKMSGFLPCFIQVTIFGIGFRYWYEKHLTVVHKKPDF